MKRRIITLTTDFGTKDGYVGAVKGVIKRINSDVEIVDITHEIEPFDILGAAFVLNNFYKFLPPETIHLVVVDPGVGGKRQPLLIKSEDFYFVGPDNGVFSFLYENEQITEMIVLTNKKYFLTKVSSTFNARDVFAPVSAYLSLGLDVKEFGNDAKGCLKLKVPQVKLTKKSLMGEIIHIDSFGNLITNVETKVLESKTITRIAVGKNKIKRIAQSYFDIPEGKVGAVVGSSGFLEIAMNKGNAQKVTTGIIGNSVTVTFK